MHMKRHISTAILVAVLLSGSTAAHAASPTADGQIPEGMVITPQIQEYLDTLPAAERTKFVNTVLPATYHEATTLQVPVDATARASVLLARLAGTQVMALASGCWAGRVDESYTAVAGNTVFTFYHVGGWCVSGSTVTSASVLDAGGETSTPGWRYEGVINRSAGVVSNQGRSYSQVKFVLGVGGWDIQTPTPCTRVFGLSNATYTWDTACGIY